MTGFTSESVWLIVIAFFFARSFEKSGLGERVANVFIASNKGGGTLGLAYSLAFAEALIAPALPSSTARWEAAWLKSCLIGGGGGSKVEAGIWS